MKYRNTKQRTRLLEILRSTNTHPTAQWLYEQLRQDYENVSLGTVYRNLTVLEEMNLLQKLSYGETADRYDANIKPHVHFLCDRCESVYDVHDEVLDKRLKGVVETIPQCIHSYALTCYGTCDACLKGNNDAMHH